MMGRAVVLTVRVLLIGLSPVSATEGALKLDLVAPGSPVTLKDTFAPYTGRGVTVTV